MAAVLLAAFGWLFSRRQTAGETGEEPVAEIPATPPPARAPWPPPPLPPPSAAIELVFNPRRAGTNLLSAAVDYEIGLRNVGEGAARDVRVDIQMLSASAAQDAQIAALFAAQIVRPAVAPFDLPPGQHVELAGMAMLPRTALNIFTIEGRQLFVPILTIRISYDRGDNQTVQTAVAHVIGVARGEGAKLAPFRIDVPPRMFDTVVARPL